MKFTSIKTTWICQLNKPENKKVLEDYKNRKDKSPEELTRYYIDVVNMLKDTPAWGVYGVNDMINKLTDAVIATLTKAKKGKTSAYAHAGLLLNTIKYFKTKNAIPKDNGPCSLKHVLSETELNELLAGVVI